jgi:hypothetical protein
MDGDKLQQWIEKKVGRKVERTANGFLLTRAELDKLYAGPSLWRITAIFFGTSIIVQAILFAIRWYQ